MNSYSTHQHLHQQFQKQIQSTDGHTNIDILTRSLSELDLMALKSNRNNNLGSDQINKQDRYTNQSINLNFDFDDSSCVPLLNKEILSHSNTSQFSSSTLFSNSDQSLADTYLNKSNSSSDPFLLQRKLRAQQSYFEAKHNEPQVYDHQPYQYLNDQPQKLSLFPIYHENHSSTRNTSSSTHSAQSPATDAQPFTAVTNFSASKQNHHQEHQALYPSELFYQNSQRSMSNIIQHQQQHLQQQQPLQQQQQQQPLQQQPSQQQQQQQQQPLQQQQQSPPMSYTCKLCSITGHWMKDCSLYIEKRPLYTHLHGFRSSFSNGSNNLLVPPQGYVCRKCAIPGHWIQHCQFKPASPPPTYVCRICNIKGHWIQQCQVGHANIDRLNSESLDRIHLDYERMQGESQRHVSTAYVIPELKMREPRTQQQARQQQYQQRSIDYQREHHFDNYTQQSMERDAQHNQHQEQQSYFLQSYTPLEYDMTSFY